MKFACPGLRRVQTFRETQPGETGVPAYSVNVSLSLVAANSPI